MSNPRNKVYFPLTALMFYKSIISRSAAVLTFVVLIHCLSCKKVENVAIGKITGPSAVCYLADGEIYYIDSLPGVKIAWTVPQEAQIISGQTTSRIKVKFGRKQGKITASYYKDGELVSDSVSSLEVTFGVPGKWCRVLDFSGGVRQGATAFSVGDKGYIGTGSDGTFHYDDFWEFDTNENTWKEKENFAGVKRDQAVAFSMGNKAYLGTGYISTDISKDFWEYDPASDSWQQKADCGNMKRQYAFGFSLNNKGYIGGGQGPAGALADFYEYNPVNNEWVQKANLLAPRIGAVCFTIENKPYVGTGRDDAVFKNDFWEFDPNDASNGLDANNNPIGKWIPKAVFPGTGRYLAVGFSINSKGYIGTGVSESTFNNDFYEYDPAQDLWTQKENLPIIRGFAVGFSVNNKGYLGTGTNGPVLNDFYVYTQ